MFVYPGMPDTYVLDTEDHHGSFYYFEGEFYLDLFPKKEAEPVTEYYEDVNEALLRLLDFGAYKDWKMTRYRI